MPQSTRRNKKKRQTRLTFEPAGSSSSQQVDGSPAASAGASSFSPAKVRYSQNVTLQSRSRRPVDRSQAGSEAASSQSRLPNTYSKGKAGGSSQPAHFMQHAPGTQRSVYADSSDESAVELNDAGGDEDDDLFGDNEVPVPQVTIDDGEEEEEDDIPIPTPRNARSSQPTSARSRRMVILDGSDNEDDDDDDDDDAPIIPSSSLRRKRPVTVDLEESDEEDNDVANRAKRRKLATTPRKRLQRPIQTSSPSKKTPYKGHRSEHQKKLEILKRRRLGEKIDELTESETESDGRRAMYDTDSDDGLLVLKEFDDESDQGGDAKDNGKRKKNAGKDKKESGNRQQETQAHANADDEDEDNMDDFVVEDDSDEPLGAPASIPLEFTAQAHKPLKEQFPFVVEWLVHNRINPAFERRDPVYINAWRKLDDSFQGLASSKFASSAWRLEFYRSLKGRPRMEAYEIDTADSGLHSNCMACGRSGHPSTRKIVFQGAPYNKQTLEDVEQHSSSSSDEEDNEEDDEEDDDNDNASIDTQGMSLPPRKKEWFVGKVCCSNAETAHRLLHWKHALKGWVEEKLEEDQWMTAEKIAAREKMKVSKRKRQANRITDGWKEQGIVASLYGDFKMTLEEARNQSTTGRGKGRGWQ